VTFGSRTFTSPGGMGLSGFADCGATLAVGSSCVVGEVQFGPTGSGSYSGQFDISHDGINASPQVLTFVGQGFCGSC
jgi:hypothetical protein